MAFTLEEEFYKTKFYPLNFLNIYLNSLINDLSDVNITMVFVDDTTFVSPTIKSLKQTIRKLKLWIK